MSGPVLELAGARLDFGERTVWSGLDLAVAAVLSVDSGAAAGVGAVGASDLTTSAKAVIAGDAPFWSVLMLIFCVICPSVVPAVNTTGIKCTVLASAECSI